MSISKRITAAVGAIALGALAAVAAVAPAHAEPGNIDPDAPRSLTVHKYALGPESPQDIGTGQEIPGGIPGTPAEWSAANRALDPMKPKAMSEISSAVVSSAMRRPSSACSVRDDVSGKTT